MFKNPRSAVKYVVEDFKITLKHFCSIHWLI